MELLRPGFPSLNHVTHKCLKEARGVKIFQQGSRGHNFMLYIGSHIPNSPYMQNLETLSIQSLCSSILGKFSRFCRSQEYLQKLKNFSEFSRNNRFLQKLCRVFGNFTRVKSRVKKQQSKLTFVV